MEIVDTSKNEFQERRRHPRYECNIIDSINQKITNISTSGAKLESARTYKLHDEISLSFPLHGNNGSTASVETKAVVTRASEGLGVLKYKYGLIFLTFPEESQKLLEFHLNLERQRKEADLNRLIFYRLPRTDVENEDSNFRLESKFSDGSPHLFELLNYSEFGARISTTETRNSVREGDIWDECRLLFKDHVLYSGSIEVRNKLLRESLVEYGISFLSAPINLVRIEAIRKLDNLTEKLNVVFTEFNGELSPPPENFKIAVSDFRYFLEKMKAIMDEGENEIKKMESQRDADWLNDQMLMKFSEPMKLKLHALIRRLHHSIRNFSPEEHKRQQSYFRAQVSHLTNACALYKRALEKPLGYAGDYLMMDILCRRLYAGNTLWEKVANYALTSIPPGHVVRQRVRNVLEKIKTEVMQRSANVTRILNLACGSCEEVVQYIEEENPSTVEFYLVDQEPRALDFSLRRCLKSKIIRGASVPTYFIHHTVKQFLKDPQAPSKYPKMDIIYSMGLFDYLPDPVAIKLLTVLFSMLKEGGKMWIGNYNVKSEYRFMMDYATDWELIYRSENDLKGLLINLPPNDFSMTIEPVGIEKANLFLVLEKKIQ